MSNQQEKLDSYLNFLKQDEDNLGLLIQISDLYQELNDLKSARIYLDRASSIEREACLSNQGLLYLKEANLPRAQHCFLEAMHYAETPALRYNAGFCHFLNSELDAALDILNPLLEGEHFPMAELLIARILVRQDAKEEAIHLIDNIVSHNPEDGEALGLLSLIQFDLDNTLAIKTAQRALKINPDNYDAKLVSIMTRLPTQETDVEEIEALLQSHSQDPRLWFSLGNVYMQQGDFKAAILSFQEAVTLYPEFYDCHIILGWCYLFANQINKATQSYLSAANLAEELADGWGGLALVYALQEDFLKARKLIDKANQLNPGNFLTEIAETIYFHQKNPKKANKHLVKALKNSKMPVSAKLAFIMEERGEFDKMH